MKPLRNLLQSVVLVLVFLSACFTFIGAQEIFLDSKLYANDSTEKENFGKSVAVDGDFMVIGSDLKTSGSLTNAGCVYCFQRTNGTWSLYQILEPNVPMESNYFGRSVAISGNTIFVGAYQSEKISSPSTGVVYVFQKIGNEWSLAQILTPSDGTNGDLFGISVSIDRNTALIGASNQSGYGAAYIFVEEDGTWSQQQKIRQSPRQKNSNFGFSVSVQGGLALVGAYNQYDTGAAYIFERHGTIWIQEKEIKAHDREILDEFGYSVSLSGKTAIIGSPRPKKNGAVYVYQFDEKIWKIKNKLKHFNSTDPFRFGESLSIFGDVLTVGTQETPGEVFIFKKINSDSGWVQHVRLLPNGGNSDCFGCSMAIDSEESVIIGAYRDNSNSGAAFFYSVGISCEDLASDCRVETLIFSPLSPVALVAEPLLLGILIVLLIGVVVLLGWCIHAKRQKDILQSSKAPNIFAETIDPDSMEEIPLNLDADATL